MNIRPVLGCEYDEEREINIGRRDRGQVGKGIGVTRQLRGFRGKQDTD